MLALGDGIKRPSLGEIRNKSAVRKSIVASKSIKAGEVFTLENLTTKRPGDGISPMRWDEIIGQKALRNYSADDLI
jgi:N,N'-diacetyllegionaminate synthase